MGRGLFHIMCALWLYITTIHISSNHWLKVQPVSVPLPEGEMGESFQFPVDLDAPEEPEESISVRSARLFTDSVFETTRMTTGWLLLACGATYLFMGACFIGYFRDVQMIKVGACTGVWFGVWCVVCGVWCVGLWFGVSALTR